MNSIKSYLNYIKRLLQIRKIKKVDEGVAPATVATVAAMQWNLIIATELWNLCRDGQEICRKIQNTCGEGRRKIWFLLRLEWTDFARYEIEAAEVLNYDKKSIIARVRESYESLSTAEFINSLPSSDYIRLRLAINFTIFKVEYLGEIFGAVSYLSSFDFESEIPEKETISRQVSFKEQNDFDEISAWPILPIEISRLIKKVENLRIRYSPIIGN